MKALAERKTRRCAIYTRKSTDEGLEQSFNSLDAQRDACAAYIRSQAHEGWELKPDYYDDGGYSGGSLERPGLQQLLEDVRAGKIDIIVVYKVDRLTRSLADFARIVDILDKQGASFVSVTQAFSTTNSMGRLTLNVLLSFAQFEREVTGERIRDKIAASKARGMWMGGVVPLGYEVKDRKLLVLSNEAERVRHIFRRYLELGSVYDLQVDLAADGIRTKARVGRDGRRFGDTQFSRGALYHMLRNCIYLGEISHRGKAYPGEHESIITDELFAAVNRLLDGNRVDNHDAVHAKHPSLLTGVLWDSYGRRMTPVHASKNGVRYRYYISRTDKDRLELPIIRIPAGEIEALVIKRVEATGEFDWVDDAVSPRQLAAAVARVIVQADQVEIAFVGQDQVLSIPAGMISRTGERRLAAPGDTFENSRRDPALIKLIVRAHQARQLMSQPATASLASAANAAGVSAAYFVGLLRIAHLAPDITAAILDGRQPTHLNREHLARKDNLPIDWAQQRKMLGFRQPTG
jgi:DNA invertase Pin-like site-specific DNA recombinase